MTTIINFNILNFFRFKLNNHTVNDVRINNNFPNRNKDEFRADDMVIDVTPYKRAIEGRGDLVVRDISAPDVKISRTQLVTGSTAVDNTYDRRGKAVQIYESKGTYIDSYA